MAGIHVYNRKNEQHVGEYNFPIYRPTILSNPFTHIKDKKTKAIYIVKDRDTAIDMYSKYFDTMYGTNSEFTIFVSRKPMHFSGGSMSKKRLIKEKIKTIFKNKK